MKSLHHIRLVTSQRIVSALAVLVFGSFASSVHAADHGRKALSPAGPAAAARPTLDQLRGKPEALEREAAESCKQSSETTLAGSCEDPALLAERDRELQQLVLHASMVDSSLFGQLRALREPPRKSSLAKRNKRARVAENCEPLK